MQLTTYQKAYSQTHAPATLLPPEAVAALQAAAKLPTQKERLKAIDELARENHFKYPKAFK